MTLRASLEVALLVAFVVIMLLAMHWREKAASEARRADSAVLQEKVTANTGAIADRVAETRVTIITRAEEQAHAIEAIPSDDLPADVRAGWCGGLRYTPCGRPDPDGPAELPGAVPGAEP